MIANYYLSQYNIYFPWNIEGTAGPTVGTGLIKELRKTLTFELLCCNEISFVQEVKSYGKPWIYRQNSLHTFNVRTLLEEVPYVTTLSENRPDNMMYVVNVAFSP